ncbi:MAG: hypothetical protein J5610_05485 [Prevotella sp.]|nr:hypothetical protein [Prevotella sp.]
MKNTNVKKNTNSSRTAKFAYNEKVFREKAKHYLVCMVDTCPLRDRCLRHIVGRYVEGDSHIVSSVNPHYPGVGEESCEFFRPNEYVMKKRGMVNFYHDMPGHMEYSIRRHLIRIFGRYKYFEMRKGTRLITPNEQQQIAEVCHLHGWTGDLHYDGEQEDWLW